MSRHQINLFAKSVSKTLLVLLFCFALFAIKHWRAPLQAGATAVLSFLSGPSQKSQEVEPANQHSTAEIQSVKLSEQARKNIGLTEDHIHRVKLSTFRRTLTLPALVVEQPGRTRIKMTTPMTGVITHVNTVLGEAVDPGRLMFEIRLTHEDLVLAQTNFLRTLGELDVEKSEIVRLQKVTKNGAIAGKILLERKYNKQKLEAVLNAQQQSLLLHGLNQHQINQIIAERKLLRQLQMMVPNLQQKNSRPLQFSGKKLERVSTMYPLAERDRKSTLVVQELNVHQGESVHAGASLCILADYSQLYVEGRAFEQDAELLTYAAGKNWKVDAVFQFDGKPQIIKNLDIAYLANEVDSVSRALNFYIHLPNRVVRDQTSAQGLRFINWAHRPGQRAQLLVPVEEWENQIVLPVEAVAREGADFFVFKQNGDQFDRRPVHVKYRDQHTVVVANDGSIFPGKFGDKIAWTGAHAMQMAIQKKSGGVGGGGQHHGHQH